MPPLPVDFIFWLALATLPAHELGAVDKREWWLLYILRRMPKRRVRVAFVIVHVPLLAVLFWLFANPDGGGAPRVEGRWGAADV